jgi:MFS family permease
VETDLHSSHSDKEDTALPNGESLPFAAAEEPRGLLKVLLQFRIFEGFRFREYRLLWSGFVCMAMGLWMDQVTRGWLIYELTNSPVQLGLVRGVQAIPILFLSPVAGSMADRYSRKLQSLIALVLDGLMYAALAVLIITGRIEAWHVYVSALGSAIVQAFHHPSRTAMVADSVPKQNLTNAIGLNSIAFNVSRSTAPAFAGLLGHPAP